MSSDDPVPPLTGEPPSDVPLAHPPLASEQLLPLLYAELRSIAGALMRVERPDHTLSPTALVHEAYLRLVDGRAVQWESRSQFLCTAAQVMRHTLVDHARGRQAAKRDGGFRVTLDPATPDGKGLDLVDVLALDDALSRLAALDERRARVVELRFFAGLDIPETARVLGTSVATVKRDWVVAKAWLYRELNPA
jgi:RNA polymerase sigma-70 factor (ECF subfamily)